MNTAKLVFLGILLNAAAVAAAAHNKHFHYLSMDLPTFFSIIGGFATLFAAAAVCGVLKIEQPDISPYRGHHQRYWYGDSLPLRAGRPHRRTVGKRAIST